MNEDGTIPNKYDTIRRYYFRCLGQCTCSLGYALRRTVYLYCCNLCKHKYHIIYTSPFMYRDKSKDVLPEVNKMILAENK